MAYAVRPLIASIRWRGVVFATLSPSLLGMALQAQTSVVRGRFTRSVDGAGVPITASSSHWARSHVDRLPDGRVRVGVEATWRLKDIGFVVMGEPINGMLQYRTATCTLDIALQRDAIVITQSPGSLDGAACGANGNDVNVLGRYTRTSGTPNVDLIAERYGPARDGTPNGVVADAERGRAPPSSTGVGTTSSLSVVHIEPATDLGGRRVPLVVGKAVDASNQIVTPTQRFARLDTFYVSVPRLPGMQQLVASWWAHTTPQHTLVAVDTSSGGGVVEFHLIKRTPWPALLYHVTVTVGADTVGTALFEVVGP